MSDQQLTPGSTSYNTAQEHPYDVTAGSHPCANSISAFRDGRYRPGFRGAEEQIGAILAAAVDFSSPMFDPNVTSLDREPSTSAMGAEQAKGWSRRSDP